MALNAFGAIHSLLIIIPAATLSALTISGTAAAASYLAVSSYFRAISASSFHKVRPWLCPIPQSIITNLAQAYSQASPLKNSFGILSAIRGAERELDAMRTSLQTVQAVYDTFNNGIRQPAYAAGLALIKKYFSAFNTESNEEFIRIVRSEVDELTSDQHKNKVKIAHGHYRAALNHFFHLLDKAAATYTRPPYSTVKGVACNFTKPLRAAISPSNHSNAIRRRKLAFQWLLCNLLAFYHSQLLSAFIARLPSDNKYRKAYNDLAPHFPAVEAEPEAQEYFPNSDDEEYVPLHSAPPSASGAGLSASQAIPPPIPKRHRSSESASGGSV